MGKRHPYLIIPYDFWDDSSALLPLISTLMLYLLLTAHFLAWVSLPCVFDLFSSMEGKLIYLENRYLPLLLNDPEPHFLQQVGFIEITGPMLIFSSSICLREVKFLFDGPPRKHCNTGSSAPLVTCGVTVSYFGRSCHSLTDLTGTGITTM